MSRSRALILSLLAPVALLAGCGPVQSTSYLLDAAVQIEAARTAGAEELAPFEWTAAALYLEKAREEIAYSEYEAGVSFAQKASQYANEARTRAMASSAEETPEPGFAPLE